MNFFDLMNLAQRVPFDLMQKLEGDIPKFQQLSDFWKQAKPHVDALEPILKSAEAVWGTVSPDVMAMLQAIKEPQQ